MQIKKSIKIVFLAALKKNWSLRKIYFSALILFKNQKILNFQKKIAFLVINMNHLSRFKVKICHSFFASVAN